jgi:polyvinyl alcohol dehydrogenase (cytochrome)
MSARTATTARFRAGLLALALAAALMAAAPVSRASAQAVGYQMTSPPMAQFAGPAAYILPVHPFPQGSSATYTNPDIALHDVIALDNGPDGRPLFKSALVSLGGTAEVVGVEDLEPGSYAFTCSLHNSMKATLEVVDSPLGGGGDPDPDPTEPPDPDPTEPPDPDPTEPPDAGDPGELAETDWPMFGRDLANSRHAEEGPEASDLLTYQEAWSYTSDGRGDFAGTPVVAGGTVFMGSSLGLVVALDEETGDVIWEEDLTTDDEGATITATVAYHDGVVYVPVSGRQGSAYTPYIAALRATDGAELWRTYVDTEQPLGDVYGSPVVWEDVDDDGEPRARLFIGTSSWNSGGSGASELHLGTVVALDLLDEGALLWRTYMFEGGPQSKDDIPISEATGKKYDGAAVWSTPTVDTETGSVYVGTGNGYESSHSLVASLVRLDADTGEMLAHYQATETDPWQATRPHTGVDADFGASPQLIEGSNGELWVGAGQKNNHMTEELFGYNDYSAMVGVARYHMVDRETMELVWRSEVGPGHFWGGITGATAYDGERIYGSTVWGQLFALNKDDGSFAWMVPAGDAVAHMAHTQVANGVVYSVDGKGFVSAYDAGTGVPVWTRSMTLSTLGAGTPSVGPSAAGVAIVDDTVFAAYGMLGAAGSIHAYR